MKILDKMTKRWLRAHDCLEWGKTVKVAGNHILNFVPTFADAGQKLDAPTDPDMSLARNYFEASSTMRSGVYFFVVSFANYMKSLGRLGIELDLESFNESKKLVKALRNIYEHWDKHDIQHWNEGKLEPLSQMNYQVFINKFPKFPNTPFWFIETQDMDLSIASFIKVRETLTKIDQNNAIIDIYMNSINSKINLRF